jgi:hypothetical protein
LLDLRNQRLSPQIFSFAAVSITSNMKMNFSIPLLSFFSTLLLPEVTAQGLNVTAIAAVNNASVLQCWGLTNPPRIFRGAANYDIGNFTNAYIGVIPPQTHIGQAWAPAPQ